MQGEGRRVPIPGGSPFLSQVAVFWVLTGLLFNMTNTETCLKQIDSKGLQSNESCEIRLTPQAPPSHLLASRFADLDAFPGGRTE